MFLSDRFEMFEKQPFFTSKVYLVENKCSIVLPFAVNVLHPVTPTRKQHNIVTQTNFESSLAELAADQRQTTAFY